MPNEEERKLRDALVAISTGVEDVSKLNVAVEVGRTPMSGGAAAWNVHKRGVFFVLRQEKLGKGGRDVTITSETFR